MANKKKNGDSDPDGDYEHLSLNAVTRGRGKKDESLLGYSVTARTILSNDSSYRGQGKKYSLGMSVTTG